MKKLLSKLKVYQNEILTFSFFILLSLLVTHPMIFKMKSHIYGYPGDPLGSVWRIWWYKFSWGHHISSRFITVIAHPFGVDLSQEISSIPFNYLVFFITLLSNEIFTYNFILLLSFLLAAITMYFLVYHLTRNKGASTVAGVLYAFCPWHFAHAGQHLSLASIQWLPLYALFLFKLFNKRTYKNAFLCALGFSLVFLTDFSYVFLISVLTAAFILWGLWFSLGPNRRFHPTSSKVSLLKTSTVILVTFLIALTMILPFTYSIFKTALTLPKVESMATLGYIKPFRDLTSNSARPLGYLLPSRNNPFFGRFTKRFIESPFYGGHPTEHTLYLGWVGIVLSIVAIRNWRRKSKLVNKLTSRQVNKLTRKQVDKLTSKQVDPLLVTRCQKGVSFFLFAAIVALIFSHSPYTEIGNFRILFPSYFMYKIAPMFRCYARFGIVVMLCVSVLAGIGFASILKRIKSAKKRRVLLSIILLLVFIEFAPVLPAPMVNAVNPPPVYEWLAKEGGDFTIAEYPMENNQEYLFWQRIHQKRLVNGAQSGTYADEVRKEIVDILKPETPGILSYLGAKYVILHPDKYLKSEDVPVIGEVPDVSKQKGLRLVKTFEEARVYEVVAAPQKPKTRIDAN